MDEGAGDQLDNSSSNLQQLLLEKNNKLHQQSLSSLNESSLHHHHHQQHQHHHHQQQQQNEQQQPPLSLSASSSSSSTTSSTSSFNQQQQQQSNILTSSQQLLLQQEQQQQQQSSSLETKLNNNTNTTTTTTTIHNPNQTSSQQDQSNNNSNIKTSEEPQQHDISNRATSNNQKQQSNNGHLPKRNPNEDLFSNEKWGTTPIRQDTPWELPPSPTQNNTNINNSSNSTSSSSSNNISSNNSNSGIINNSNSINNTTSTSSSNSNNSAAVGLIGSAGGVLTGSNPSGPTTLPPGISQSGDSFRSGASVNDFHGQAAAMINNFGMDSMGANGLATSLGQMNMGGGGGGGGILPSRFDQPWRAPVAKNPTSMAANSSPFANHNLMNPVQSMQKSMPNSGAGGNGGSSFVGMQQSNEFARAPGPATSIMDYNTMTQPKPFGMTNRSSTWSAFGSTAPNEPEPSWPKTTISGISSGNSTQPSNAFDLVPEFEPGKPWRGSMLMKSIEDDPTMTPGSMARSLAPQRKTIWSDEIL